MKNIVIVILLFGSLISPALCQTANKTTPTGQTGAAKRPVTNRSSVKRTDAQQAERRRAAREAAIAKAKEDSAAAVYALALQLAKQMIREDSIRKEEAAAAQLEAEEKQRQAKLAENTSLSRTERYIKWKSEKNAAKDRLWGREEVEWTRASSPSERGTRSWLGFRGMGSISIIPDDDVAKPYIGYGGGLVANFGGRHFSFQPEVLYAQQGVTGKMADSTSFSTVVNVIQVPLLLKYSVGRYNKGFFINIGPYGSYVLNAVNSVGSQKETRKPEEFTLEYGVSGGLGVSIRAGRGRFLIEARGSYYLGTTVEVVKETKFVTGAFSLGYLFPLGH